MTARDTLTTTTDGPSAQGHAHLLGAALARLRMSMTAMPFMALLFGLLLLREGGDPTGWGIWGGFYLPSVWGMWRLHRRYRTQQRAGMPMERLAWWQRRIQVLAACHGLALALTVLLPGGDASYDYMLLLHATLIGIGAANAGQMTASMPVYRAFFYSLSTVLLPMPWTFPEHWTFIVPMSLVMSVVLLRSAGNAHRFFVRQVVLEERSRDLAHRYREASQAAHSALEEKNRFLSTAAHDLRQPVHAMGLLAEAIALRSQGQPAMEALVAQWRLSMRSVSQMFDALLDLSRIESGTMALRPAPVALAPLLADLHAQFLADAHDRQLALRLRLPPADATVLADPVLLRQSLSNLLQNALRYTPRGGVLLGARRRGAQWRIEVWDTGVGVALEDQSRIYEPYFRPEQAWHVHQSGHGLGLAVVARCATLMQAGLGLQSRLGRGSCFWLALPATAAPEVALSARPGPASGAAGPLQGRCLVLDDDPQVLAAWTRLLAAWGVDARMASDARSAMAHLDAGFEPHAILCDQRLRSGESGLEVLGVLLERCPGAAGALVSGEFDAPELAQAEADGYPVLRKPVDVDTLHAVLAQWLPSGAFEAPSTPGTAPPGQTETRPA